jgi:O-acetyl-ADP-ribose deacetylase (regulator of RNase III)
MPIKFVSTLPEFVSKMEGNYESYCMNIEDYKCERRTYYVSPANSLGFMDGGIDYALSRVVFPDIEVIVKEAIKKEGKESLIGRWYLPIGSSIIIPYNNHYLVVAPTMLLPQNVSNTRNAYYATMATLRNIVNNCGESIDDVDIIFTSMCCGYGKMSVDESIKQILEGISDYDSYIPEYANEGSEYANEGSEYANEGSEYACVINEPNLYEQPKIYENCEFFNFY